MLKYINQMPNEFDEQLNKGILDKTYDKPLEKYIYDAFVGFEIIPNIRIIGYEYVPDEDKYDVNDHVVRRNANKKKMIKHISESRCGVMYIDVEIYGYDTKTGKNKLVYLKKPIILPIVDDDGYMMIKGKKCYLIYQLVDKMLYPSFGAVTIKSLMPICVKNKKEEFVDSQQNEYTIPVYNIQIFKSAINVLMIYSNMTVQGMLNFMEVNRFIRVEKKQMDYSAYNDDPNKVIRFECDKHSDISIVVLRDIFEKEIYVRSIVACMIDLFNETEIKFEKINDWEEWMTLTGGKGTVRRGIYQHIFFNRLLDEVTKNEIKINEYDRQDIYHLLKWVIQNYHTLWAKDNLSMINKRLRCNEYIGSFITAEISKRINRIVSLGDKATIRDLLNAFRFPEDLFLTRLHSSGVLRYAENDSDMDMEMKLKWTSRGPNSVGNKDTRRISIRQRMLHPSMLGVMDLASNSSSQPGRNGSLSPYCEMDSMYFDDSLYENEMHFHIAQLLNDMDDDPEAEELIIKCDTAEEYNKVLDALYKAGSNKFKFYGVSSAPMDIIVEADPREKYRKFDEEKLLMKENNT